MKLFPWLQGLVLGSGNVRLEEGNVRELTNEAQLAELLEASRSQPVFAFKHSTACPISAAAYRRVAQYLEEAGSNSPPFYLVKVIESRPLSNAMTRELGVQHASPQLILLRDARPRWNASHGAITAEAIEEALARPAAN